MLQYFTEVITKQYGFKRKPDSEGFMYLIEKYKIDKTTTLVIGDRECKILGGKAAEKNITHILAGYAVGVFIM